MIGAQLVVPPNQTRAQYIRQLFGVDRTQALLAKHKKVATADNANKILDALCVWDADRMDRNDEPGALDLARQYNKLLREFE